MLMSCALPSTIAASITWPSPDVARSTSAARMPITTSEPPPPKSASKLIGGTGAPPSGPDVPEHARDREVVHVVADVARERAALAPAGHARVHEARVARPARVGPDAEPLGDAGPEPFEQHVGLLAQAQHHLGAALVLQVDADAAPPAVDHRVRRHEPGDARTGRDVGGAVEAQHLGAHVGEQHPRELHRPDVRQLDHADARERPATSGRRSRQLEDPLGVLAQELGPHVVAERHVGQLARRCGRR